MVVLKCFCRELKARFKLSKGFSETTKVILRVKSAKGIKKKSFEVAVRRRTTVVQERGDELFGFLQIEKERRELGEREEERQSKRGRKRRRINPHVKRCRLALKP